MMKTTTSAFLRRFLVTTLVACTASVGDTITWDFEGDGTGTLGDTTGQIFFKSDVDPDANDTAWAVGNVGVTQVVNYAGLGLLDGEHNNRAVGNDWFLRSDHANSEGVLTKPGDGRTGNLISDPFVVNETSSFSFFLGGGITGGSLVLRKVEDDSVVLFADPLVNGHIYRTGNNSQADDGLQTWESSDLSGAGVAGDTEVYLSVEDDSTGGWGHLQLDDIVAENVTVGPGAPQITSFTSTPDVLATPGAVTLSWEVEETATSIEIDQGVGVVTGLESVVVNLTESTTFTLTATNEIGSRSTTLEVLVAQLPVINDFSVNLSPILAGQSVQLAWDVTYADSLSIDQGVGVLEGDAGTISVTPASTVTYQLSATNIAGTSTAEVTVNVASSGILWDFEGDGGGTLFDTSGTYAFRNTVDPALNDTTWSVGAVGDTNPVRYDAISDSQPSSEGNDWFLRCDWNTPDGGVTHFKHRDGQTGILQSDPFVITNESAISFEIGGSDDPSDGVFLRRSSDDSVLLEARARGHMANSPDASWGSSDLEGAGVTGPTEVYLTIEDNTVGGWGHMQVDNILVIGALGGGGELAVTNLEVDPVNETATLTWNSRAGVNYQILWSPDLDFSGEFEIDDLVVGQDGSTTFGPFPMPAVPGGGVRPKVFFQIRETP